jgi:predicted Zn-dependent protease
MLISRDQEIAMGQQGAEQVRASIGLVENQALQDYVSEIGLAMAEDTERPDLPWSFEVADDPVINAFALPGGPIYVTRGILAYFNSEAELATVLGHEAGHITGRHSAEQMSRQQLYGGLAGLGAA